MSARYGLRGTRAEATQSSCISHRRRLRVGLEPIADLFPVRNTEHEPLVFHVGSELGRLLRHPRISINRVPC